MTGNTGTAQACAACKFQRRKCSPECPLAPYFPPDQPKQFLNVHRLYGVSNTLRILKQVADPSKRNDAMKSILYEADARDRDPVNGCYGVITLLQSQVEILREELDLVRSQVHILEQQQQQQSLANYYFTNQHHAQNNMLGYGSHPNQVTTPSGGVPSWLYQYMAASPHTLLPPQGGMGSPPSLQYKPSIDVKPSFDTRLLDYDEPKRLSVYQEGGSSDQAYESSAESTSIGDSRPLDHLNLGNVSSTLQI